MYFLVLLVLLSTTTSLFCYPIVDQGVKKQQEIYTFIGNVTERLRNALLPQQQMQQCAELLKDTFFVQYGEYIAILDKKAQNTSSYEVCSF